MRQGARRWWDRLSAAVPGLTLTVALLRRAFSEFRADHCQQFAAAISYHVLFSVFPITVLGVAVLGLVADGPQVRSTIVESVVAVVPLTDTGQQQLGDLLASLHDSAGALGVLGVVGVLWAATGVMASVRTALNVAWDTEKPRPFIQGKLVDLLLVAATVVLLLTAFAGTLLVNLPSANRPPVGLNGPALTLATSVVGVALLTGTFVALFRLVPATATTVRDVWPGALVGALGLQTLQVLFSIYVTHFANYDRVYGPLATVVAALFFVYLAATVFLFGAEVAAEYPRVSRQAGSDR